MDFWSVSKRKRLERKEKKTELHLSELGLRKVDKPNSMTVAIAETALGVRDSEKETYSILSNGKVFFLLH